MKILSTGFDLVLADRQTEGHGHDHTRVFAIFRPEHAINLYMIGIPRLKGTTEMKIPHLTVFRNVSYCYLRHHCNAQPGRQCTYNVIQRCVRVTIVAVEKQ
jgi:hypothetical protein